MVNPPLWWGGVVTAAVLLILAGFTRPGDTVLWVLAAVLLVLAAITAFYGQQTQRLAAMMEAHQRETVAPLMLLRVSGTGDLRLRFRNGGGGPALHFRCWIEDPDHPELRSRSRAVTRAAVPAGGKRREARFLVGLPDYLLGEGTAVRAQLEDLRGTCYETVLTVGPDGTPHTEHRAGVRRVELEG